MNGALRKEYLAAMGLESWVVRTPAADAAAASTISARAERPAIPQADEVQAASAQAVGIHAAGPRTVPPAAVTRTATSQPAPMRPTVAGLGKPAAAVTPAGLLREDGYDWTQLRSGLRPAPAVLFATHGLRRCSAWATKPPNGWWWGEAPGAEEDRQGETVRRPCRPALEFHAARHRPAAPTGVISRMS